MIFDAIKQKEVQAIPSRLLSEWNFYTRDITGEETSGIIEWINNRFDSVLDKPARVQPSGWLGSGFDWTDSPLFPIYRECSSRLPLASDEEKEVKSGQIFGLFISLVLAEHRPETWFFVKGEGYEAHGVPIRSRIYFLPDK